MLDRHVHSIVNQNPRLLRVLFSRQIDYSTDLDRLVVEASAGVLSGGERALAFCLLHLLDAPDIPQSFGECFERLDSRDRAAILLILANYDAEVSGQEQTGRELIERTTRAKE